MAKFVIQKLSNNKYYQDVNGYNDLLKISKDRCNTFTENINKARKYHSFDSAFEFIKDRRSNKYQIIEIQ